MSSKELPKGFQNIVSLLKKNSPYFALAPAALSFPLSLNSNILAVQYVHRICEDTKDDRTAMKVE
jgi:hypothetical protein